MGQRAEKSPTLQWLWSAFRAAANARSEHSAAGPDQDCGLWDWSFARWASNSSSSAQPIR